MQVFNSIQEFSCKGRPVVTVGVFDGVHTGHRGILERLIASAREKETDSVVITFNPHPRLVVSDSADVRLLQSIDEKLERFRIAGIDIVLVIPFDMEFAQTDPADFIRNILVERLKVSKVVTGHDHLFGRGRQGDFEMLVEMGASHGFEVEQVSAIQHCGKMVSSSEIRKAIGEGNMDLANCMLGYLYSLKGKVVRGNQIGKLIGFPTANIQLSDSHKFIPALGVYTSLVKWNGNIYKGMSNIGVRPTIDANRLTIEVNIFDFDQDIYTENITLYFIHRIRDEKKFGGLEQLKNQLLHDREEVRKLLENYSLKV